MTGCGGIHRREPKGGAAKGIPLKSRIEASAAGAPETSPPSTRTGSLADWKAAWIAIAKPPIKTIAHALNIGVFPQKIRVFNVVEAS